MTKHTQIVTFPVGDCHARGEIVSVMRGFAYIAEFLTDLQPANCPLHKVSLDRLLCKR